jgi:hypothetical protein
MAVTDTFTLDESMQVALAAETVRLVKRAALERACKVARRTQRHAAIGSLVQYREHRLALENVLLAAEAYVGIDTKEDDDNG